MTERDWKTYSRMVPELRERYLKEKNAEIVAILEAEEKSQTERFRDARDKIERERKILEACLDPHSRSKMQIHLLLMYRYGMLKDADLDNFSGELREQFRKYSW